MFWKRLCQPRDYGRVTRGMDPPSRSPLLPPFPFDKRLMPFNPSWPPPPRPKQKQTQMKKKKKKERKIEETVYPTIQADIPF
ncbi:hypothetical protein CEXT_542681 [Caerostris extrusa]|uniref:Uncharacterized protein n=1 Tax=Caerostris extrusa TaxID=172846 RepID=A0AAV4PSR6_CAEEX|nr:hypothetical protein CEXT_542681 [Caerostris extrusa]